MSTVPPAAAATVEDRFIDPREGVQHLKEIDEGRHQRVLGAALAIEPHHFAHQVDGRGLETRYQRRQVPRVVHDVRIGQQQHRRIGQRDALVHRPELPGPTVRLGLAGNDLKSPGRNPGDGGAGKLSRAVARSICRSGRCEIGRHKLGPPATRPPDDGRRFITRRNNDIDV